MDPTFVRGMREAKALLDEGVLSQGDFESEKARLLKQREEREAAGQRMVQPEVENGMGKETQVGGGDEALTAEPQVQNFKRQESEEAGVAGDGDSNGQKRKEYSMELRPEVRAALEAIRATDAGAPSQMPDKEDEHAGQTRGFCHFREWQAFCERVARGEAKPSCVIDFPYADKGGLDLVGDDRLLERMYCFHDSAKGDPSRW
jgi:hypothetical protein